MIVTGLIAESKIAPPHEAYLAFGVRTKCEVPTVEFSGEHYAVIRITGSLPACLKIYGTAAKKRKTANRTRWTIPWSTVVRPDPMVRREIMRVTASSNSSLALRPSVRGLPRSIETLATAGIVSPMVANTDPRARFMLVCRRFAVAARYEASPSGRSTNPAITIPTTLLGAPTAAMPASSVGVSAFANATTATNETRRNPTLTSVVLFGGGGACDSSPPSAGRKKSRWRKFCTNRNEPYRINETIAAKMSCDELNVGPAEELVKLGKIRVSIVNAIRTESAACAP
jgi:hypothetical protein